MYPSRTRRIAKWVGLLSYGLVASALVSNHFLVADVRKGNGLAILLAIAIPTAWLWRRDRRHPPGHCQRCGYDLTGNVTGVCSECAAKVKGP